MNKNETALVLLELQNDFLSEEGRLYPLVKPVLEANGVLGNLTALIQGSREAGVRVIHTPIQFSEDFSEMGPSPYGILKAVKDAGALVRGSWGAQLHPSYQPVGNDVLIEGKTSIDAFASTNLDYMLRSMGVRTIVLAGQLTNICIESTMRSAFDKGYAVIGITDATSTLGLDSYRQSIESNWPMFSRPMTHTEFLNELAA